MSRVRADPITAALAHPTRRSLYISLSNTPEMSTVQLQNIVEVDRYNLYHHLKKLTSLGLIENHRDEGRARWWKVAQTVDLPEILSISSNNSNPAPITTQVAPLDLDGQNTHVISLEGSRDRVGAKLLLEQMAQELGIELNLPWNFVPEKIALISED
ncbi:MAG: helix-turn-helix domain-containing protein [Candidatus Thermoplasmatota archaeon]|nr:helix-turn-helix domain-containing protein [Candidatus Thermoplasmatota archaeon]|tara:strand:- start:95 stop:565 length:471 start_codon:yes stop_codon:yes gene_type:complete